MIPDFPYEDPGFFIYTNFNFQKKNNQFAADLISKTSQINRKFLCIKLKRLIRLVRISRFLIGKVTFLSGKEHFKY